MNKYLLAVVLGFLGWLIGYIAGIPLLAAQDYMHTAQSVLGMFLGMLFASWYFFRIGPPYMMEGLKLGIIWLMMMVVLDYLFLLPFIAGGISEWFASIGLGYLGIPIMTTIFGWALDRIGKK